MLSIKEKKALEKIVADNDLVIVLESLSSIASETADQLSDLGLKEKAAKSSEISDKLKELCSPLKKI